jgi:hypothetical protein
MPKINYKKLKAKVEVYGNEGSVTWELNGDRVDENGGLAGVPEYLAKLAGESITNVEDKEHKALVEQNNKLAAQCDKLQGEIENMQKAARAKKQ